MARFIIEGGTPLHGELTPQGAKNEALQVICATLLTSKKVTISNIPEISDVLKLIDILRFLGTTVEHLAKGVFTFQSDNIHIDHLRSAQFYAQAGALRGSLMIVGPLLARFGVGIISQPGGDKIGRRRLDTHFRGFEALGANFTFDADESSYRVEAKVLKGCFMLLDEASVTGTANLVMAATLAVGRTTIYNAAREP
jgi:UDP-N-acetylglucosamine 1-carboxyvinyltransferase